MKCSWSLPLSLPPFLPLSLLPPSLSPSLSPSIPLSLPAVSHPTTIITSSASSAGGHMMYPSPHTVMYATPTAEGGGGLTVLNPFPPSSTIQLSHSQAQDTGQPITERRWSPFLCTDCKYIHRCVCLCDDDDNDGVATHFCMLVCVCVCVCMMMMMG